MGRPLRAADAGYAYHCLNRANGRLPLFDDDADYAAFERVLQQACDRVPIRVLSYCIMPNHWHLVVWPRQDGDLSRFMGWLTLTHTQRWHAHHHSAGTGHLYQGRFKSFPIQEDDHFLTVCRYVERNPLRAGLARMAQNWRWSSLWRREYGDDDARALLADWPVPRPRKWLAIVNAAQTPAEVEEVRQASRRGRPLGDDRWVTRTVKRLGLESALRPRGRPRKAGMENKGS